MSLSSDFKNSPQVWIMTHTYLVIQGNNPTGPKFATGTGKFKFVDANTGPGTCFLEKSGGLSFDYFNAFLF